MAKFDPNDRYTRAAQQKGLKSRAAFKLQELDQQFRLFRPGHAVLDLGAAPGGWLQVALAAVGPKGRVLGVDLQAIQGLSAPNLSFIEGDLLDPETLQQVQKTVGPVDIVLSDMAPSTTGIKFQDQLRSAELVRQALQLAYEALKPGGHFVAKIFPGEELAPLKQELKKRFGRVKEFIPTASRKSSSEIYLVAKGLKEN